VDTENPQKDTPEALVEGGPFDSILEGQLSAMAAEREQFAAEKKELEERLLRARAEFENARRRWDRERLDYFQFAAMDMVRDLLPILDDFERALQVETTDREYAKGVELIYQRMSDTLTKLGLEPIETAGRRALLVLSPPRSQLRAPVCAPAETPVLDADAGQS